jgi:hypothetical protein
MTDQARCRSCGAPIIWAFNANGRRMPVDYVPVSGGNLVLTERGPIYEVEYVEPTTELHYRSHFATCPDREEWRKS